MLFDAKTFPRIDLADLVNLGNIIDLDRFDFLRVHPVPFAHS